jgi:hypothetical protein
LYIPIITEIDDLAREMFAKQRKFRSFAGNSTAHPGGEYRDLAL